MRIVTVVGARPQFVKAAVVSREIREHYGDRVREFLVHTGQHYDASMSDVFFEEMNIPKPDVNLEVGSGTHGRMTAEMLMRIENILLENRPDAVLVYGDTNSTLAGALAASKLLIPVIHVEAGLRSYNRAMPEEQNRVLTDHVSSLLFCPTEVSQRNLEKEGITAGVHVVGDVMYDASLYYRELSKSRPSAERIQHRLNLPKDFVLMTLHRAENTDSLERLSGICAALNTFRDLPVVFPVHPRTRKALEKAGIKLQNHILQIDPVGFFDMIDLESLCSLVVTDSGGVQKEAYFFEKPCITLRDETEWVETVETGWNTLAGSDTTKILNALTSVRNPDDHPLLYGDGHAAEKIMHSTLQILVSGVTRLQ